MTIKTSQLQAALKLLDLVPVRAGIRPSEFVRMETAEKGLVFSLASDLLGSVAVEGEPDGLPPRFYFDRVQFIPLVLSLDAGRDVEMSRAGENIVIRQGSRKASYSAVEEVTGYARVKPEGHQIVLDSDLMDQVKAAMSYIGRASMSPELMAVWYDSSMPGLLATDRFSVYGAKLKIETKRKSVAFPAALWGAASPGMIWHSADDSVSLSVPNGALRQTFTEAMASQFPLAPIRKALEGAAKYKPRLRFVAARMAEALQRMRACLTSAVSDTASVMVEAAKGKLVVQLVSGQVDLRETVKADVLDASASAEWLLSSILPFVSAMPSDAVVEAAWDDGTPFRFSSAKPDRILLSPRRAE